MRIEEGIFVGLYKNLSIPPNEFLEQNLTQGLRIYYFYSVLEFSLSFTLGYKTYVTEDTHFKWIQSAYIETDIVMQGLQ